MISSPLHFLKKVYNAHLGEFRDKDNMKSLTLHLPPKTFQENEKDNI